jgi:rhodanese-related sulfurtransferase
MKLKVRVRPMTRTRECTYRTMKAVFFPRNKYIDIQRLQEWYDTKYVLNMDLLYKMKDECNIENSFFVIDARRQDEYNYSHLKYAVNMPSMLPSHEFLAAVHKDTPIVVYCTVGVRSGILTRRLNKLGFNKAMTLAGGMYGWVNEALPLYSCTKDGYKTVDKVKPQHWWASLFLKPDKIYEMERQTQNGVLRKRLLASVRRVLIGANSAWRSTREYHRQLKIQSIKKESNRTHLFKLLYGSSSSRSSKA